MIQYQGDRNYDHDDQNSIYFSDDQNHAPGDQNYDHNQH